MSNPSVPPALSFAAVADAYAHARPTYPDEAVRWLTGDRPARVLELGAGTGKLTASLVGLGHDVVATDPLAPMLHHLATGAPGAAVAQAVAERIPLRARSVDVVVSAQAFHWFDRSRAVPEIARVLRPGGQVALVWNERDERIPWVRRLGAIIGTADQDTDPTNALIGSTLFGYVEKATFRFWQPMNRERLHDLVRSRSQVATMTETEQRRVLAQVDMLYAEYGRGHDGLLMPYVTTCYKAVVHHRPAEEPQQVQRPTPPPDDYDGDALLIDFT